MIAVLTNSAVVIRWPQIANYIEEPLDSAFASFAADSEFNSDYQRDKLYVTSAQQSWLKSKSLSKLVRTFVPLTKRRIYDDKQSAYFFEICSNPLYYAKLQKYGLVSKRTVDNAIVKLYDDNACKSCSDDDKLNSVLEVGYEVGGNLLNRLWIPKKPLHDRIEYYFNSEFKSYFVIGIQLRYHYLDDNKDTPKFIECAESIEKNVIALIGQTNFAKSYKGFKWSVLFVRSNNESIFFL